MKNQQATVGVLALVVAFFSLSFTPNLQARPDSNADGCKKYIGRSVPRFRKGRRYKNSGGLLTIYVAIAPADLDQDKILALVCNLGKQNASEEAVSVYVFDRYDAARHFNPNGEGNSREANLSFVARYGFFRNNKGGQGLSWRPDPKDYNRWTHIDLGGPPER